MKKYIIVEANDYYLCIREDFGYTDDKKEAKKILRRKMMEVLRKYNEITGDQFDPEDKSTYPSWCNIEYSQKGEAKIQTPGGTTYFWRILEIDDSDS